MKESTTITINDFGISFPQVSSFVEALNEFGLENIISGQGHFTLFIPTNEAFKELTKDEVAFFVHPTNYDQVQKLLKYHFIPQLLPSSSLRNGDVLSPNGNSVTVLVTNNHILVNNFIVS